jgi:HK97 family phage major capsid protein
MIEGTSRKMFLGYPVVISQVMRKTAANSVICALFGDMALAASFGDRKGVMIATSEHAVIGGVSVFERDEIAVRGIERFDFVAHSIGDATNAGPMVGLMSAGS